MNSRPVASRMLWVLALAAVFVFLNVDSMWSLSVDLAHHYALAFRISEQWVLAPQMDPTLGEMNTYPRGAHTIAATLGVLSNSTFLGLQLTVLLSFACLWLAAVFILDSLPRVERTVSLVAFVALLSANALIFKFDVHGHEVIGNFFFSQLVAHAFLFAAIVVAIAVEKRRGSLWAGAVLVPMMFANESIHVLPALVMLGLIASLVAVHLFLEYRDRTLDPRKVVFGSSIATVSFVGFFLHPSFAAMREAASHNGSLELANISYPVGLMTLCAIVAIVSAALFFLWFRSRETPGSLTLKYLALCGGLTASLCMLQYASVFFGQGSDYAVKKYGFALVTLLILQLAAVFPRLVAMSAKSTSAVGNGGSALYPVVLVLASVVALFINVPRQKTVDVSEIVAIERKLINLVDTALPVAETGKPNVVVGIGGSSSVIDYLFAISLTKTPRDLAIPDVLIAKDQLDLRKYSYFVSASNDDIYGSSGCESSSEGAISIVRSQCLQQRQASASRCRGAFDLSSNGLLHDGMLKGFSAPEAHGRWTDGNYASFECSAGDAGFESMKLEVTPFIYGRLKKQRIEISIDGRVVHQESLSAPRGAENPIVLDLPPVPANGRYVIGFGFPDAASPSEVGLSEDARKLGFSFQKIGFE